MEIAEVRKRVHESMARAKKKAAERRERTDAAAQAFERFLDRTAIPLVRQIANVLRADKYPFTVFTPSGTVRLMSDKSADDFIEIWLDSTGDSPLVVVHTSRSRGRRGVDAQRVVASGDPGEVTEEELLTVLLEELEPFVER